MSKPVILPSEKLKVYSLSNSLGTSLEVLNLGASVFSLKVRDKYGDPKEMLVGTKSIDTYLTEAYLEEDRCFGSSVGRYAGRISRGTFELGDRTYKLFEKEGVHLHGGFRGFQHKLWQLETKDVSENSLCFSCFSPDGEEGYPGNLEVKVNYTLTNQNELIITYVAQTNKATPVNLTNHNYYNLNGKGSVSDHYLFISSNSILEVDEKQRPTGKFVSLEGHSKDFSESKTINKREVDDAFVLKNEEVAVHLYAPQTGIEMQVRTNQPSVVIYIPNELPAKWEYKNELEPFPSICIETQNFPDAPNHSNFPSAILQPGETYLNQSNFSFRIKENL